MGLEIKHLKGYLGTGLMCSITDLINDKDENHIKALSGIHYDGLCILGTGGMFGFYQRAFLSIKPIVYPLLSLVKPFGKKDEKFIPIEKLSDLFNVELSMDSEDSFFFGNNESGGIILSIEQLHFNMVEKLYEWHFDVHGLIEKGLAIDVTTLTDNPYL